MSETILFLIEISILAYGCIMALGLNLILIELKKITSQFSKESNKAEESQ